MIGANLVNKIFFKSIVGSPFIIALLLLAFSGNVYAQENDDIDETVEYSGDADKEVEDEDLDDSSAEDKKPLSKREIKKWINWADEAYYDKNYRKAIIYYEALAEEVKEDNAYFKFRAGICYLLSSLNSKRAIELIEAGEEELKDSEIRSEYYYYLGRAYHFDEQYSKAKVQYELAGQADSANRELQIEVERQMEMCQYGEQFVKEPGNVMIANAGLPLNSEYPDYKPVPNYDESQVIFTSRRQTGNGDEKDETGRFYEDVFVSNRDEFGNWSIPEPLSDEINSDKHESSSFLSENGDKLIIYKSTKKGGAGLYLTEFNGKTWSKPESFGETVNSKFWETSAALSPDGKTLYFVSNRRGGIGGRDIYYSRLQETGLWGPAINLVDLNTEFDEESPFMSSDGKTIYFSSQGHSSIGGFDIFKSTLENGEWSTPENLGHPVNTPADEAHYTITKDGTRAFFTSARVGGKGETDVYALTYLDNYKMDVPLRTFVRNENEDPIPAKISIVNAANLRPVKSLDLGQNADYLSFVQAGKSYQLIVEAEGYTAEMLAFKVPSQDNYHEVYQYIQLKQKEMFGKKVAQTITVSHLFEDVKENLSGDKNLKEYTHPINREYLLITSNKIMNNWDDLSKVEGSVNSADKITGLVSSHYPTIINDKLYSDLNSYTHFYTFEQKDLLAKVVGDDTVYVIPPTTPDKPEIAEAIDKRMSTIEQNLSEGKEVEVTDLAAMATGEKEAVGVEDKLAQSGVGQGQISQAIATGSAEGLVAQNPINEVESQATDQSGGETREQADQTSGTTTTTAPRVMHTETVQFGYDKTGLSESYKKELDELIAKAKANPNTTIEIEGHTDSRGSETYNKALSTRRAKIVADYIAKAGIPRKRMKVVGYGESRPIAPNANPDGSDNPAGREKNRRTEVRLKG